MSEHLDILTKHCDVSRKSVCDIGAGDGSFAASLVNLGANVTAVEVDEQHVSAIKQAHGDTITALMGEAQALPLPDASVDLACFMFSFHHVPLHYQETAISEAQRVLRPAGRLHVADPRPFGQLTEVLLHVDDETEVRTISQKRMDNLHANGNFVLVSKDEYTLVRTFKNFNELTSKLIMNDTTRAERLPSVRDKMETAFHKLSKKTEMGFVLNQPCVSFHFERAR